MPADASGRPPAAGRLSIGGVPSTNDLVARTVSWFGNRLHLSGLLLVITVAAVFFPTLQHDFICYDDNGYVTANRWVQNGLTWSNIGQAFRTTEIAYWHPLTWISHLLDVELFGPKAWGHHLTSVLLHVSNALLVFLLLRKLTGAVWRSWVVGALFGLHPLHVESVAWVAERKDVLSTFFFMLTLYSYAQWVELKAANRGRAFVFYGLSLLAFTAALMSKPMVVTLPCVLLLLDYWPLNRWGRSANAAVPAGADRWCVEKIPFFILSIAASIATVWAQQVLGTVQTVAKYPWTIRLANALLSYGRYLEKCFFPAKLAVFYPFPEHPPIGPVLLSGIVLAAITAVAVWWRTKRPYFLMGWLWYLGMLVPVIGLIQVGGQGMADRYTYVPLLGVFVALVWLVAELTEGWSRRPVILGVVVATIISASATLTIRQLRYWQDSVTLFRHALAVTEDNWCAHFCLGYYFATSPAHETEAIAEYRATLAIAPEFSEAHFSLGTVLARHPDTLSEAMAEYQNALRINPRYSQAQFARGKALMQLPERLPDAVTAFESAVRLDPANPDAHLNLGDALAQIPQRLPDAITEYMTVLGLRPDLVGVHHNLAHALAQIPERLPEAVVEYQILLRARPDFSGAHNNLATVLAQIPGRSAEAIAEYEAALRVRPDDYYAQFNLGLLLSRLPGRTAEAVIHFEAALRINPDLEPARRALDQLRGGPAPQ